MKFFIIVIELKKTFMCEKYCEIMWHPDAYTLLSLHNYNIFVQMECIYVLY